MQTFVFVHGSWHGAWNWHRVIPLLERAGHKGIAIDLPGMNQDKTPVKNVTLEMSVKKLCEVLDSVDDQVVLVGHSKNGIMISQAAEFRPHKIKKLVYLAAYLIPNGKTMREYSLQDTGGWLKPYVSFHEELNATTLGQEIFKEGLYHDCGEEITELARVLLCPEPMETATTALQLTDKNFGSIPRVYIECLQDRAITPFMQKKMYSEMPCEKLFSMNTSHSPFFSQPEELVNLLCQI